MSCYDPCNSNSAIEQAVDDALADRITDLDGFKQSASTSAQQSAASAAESAASAQESKGFRDQAQEVANTASALVPDLLEISNDIQEAAETLEAISQTASSFLVRNFFYTVIGGENTLTFSPDQSVATVQAIYIEGSRQDAGYGYTFDAPTKTITFAETFTPEQAGTVLTIQIGQTNADSPESVLSALAGNNGASLVGTGTGQSVQVVLNLLQQSVDQVQAQVTANKTDLADPSQAAKGDALIAVKQPFTGAASRTQHDKNADVMNMRDADGLDPTGLTDSTIAIQTLLNSFGVKGGVVHVRPGDKFLIGNLTVPQNVAIVGSMQVPGEAIYASNQSYASFGSQFIQKPGSTITIKRGASVRYMQNISKALYDLGSITTDAQALAAIAAFTGTAYTSVEADFTLADLLVIGFTSPLSTIPTASDTGRRVLENFKYDCTNGPHISYATDIDRFRGVHGWPFLTAHVDGLSPTMNDRSGVGFHLSNVADFAYLDCCFNFGYATGFLFEDVWNVTVTGGGADRVGTTGVSYQGNCRFSRLDNFIINSNNTGIAINITQGSQPNFNPDIKSNHCIINAVSYGVYVTAGAYHSESDTFMGGTGIAYTDGTTSGSVSNPYFDGVGTPLAMTATAAGKVSRHNFLAGPSQALNLMNEQRTAVATTMLDPRPLAVGNGHYLEQGGVRSGALKAGFSRTGPRLQSGTLGAESANWVVTMYQAGAWMDRLVVVGDGTIRPAADGTQPLGAGNFRWGQIYSATSTISTSDENAKMDIVDIPDVVLDVWAKIDFQQYKFKDAVDAKGEKDARYHFGVIAQRVRDAFAEAGLSGFAYGLLCYDEWEASEAQTMEDEEGNVVVVSPATEAGSRYGIRYDEAFALECALQRRTTNKLLARLEALEAKNS